MNVNVSELGPSVQCTELAHQCIVLLNRAHPKRIITNSSIRRSIISMSTVDQLVHSACVQSLSFCDNKAFLL